MVVREGERVSADQILKLRAIRESGRDNRSLQTAAGLIICILLLFYVGFYFGQKNISKFKPDSRDLLFLTAVFVALFVLVKLSIIFSAGMSNTFAYLDSSVYYYAVPFALGRCWSGSFLILKLHFCLRSALPSWLVFCSVIIC